MASDRYLRTLAKLKAERDGTPAPRWKAKNPPRKPGPKKNNGKGGGGGHVPTILTRAKVRKCREVGLTVAQTGHVMNMGEALLHKCYQKELDEGQSVGIEAIAQTVFRVASDTEHRSWAAAAFFYLKTQGGWRETNRMEIGGINGQPIQMEAREVINSRALSYEQRQELRQILQAAISYQPQTDEQEPIEAEYEEVEN